MRIRQQHQSWGRLLLRWQLPERLRGFRRGDAPEAAADGIISPRIGGRGASGVACTERLCVPTLALVFAALAALSLAGCRNGDGTLVASSAGSTPMTLRYRDVAEQAGIRFRHVNGAFGRKWMPETMGAGCAFIDYDNDGWQ